MKRVSKVDDALMWERLHDLARNGKATKTRIENADRCIVIRQIAFSYDSLFLRTEETIWFCLFFCLIAHVQKIHRSSGAIHEQGLPHW